MVLGWKATSVHKGGGRRGMTLHVKNGRISKHKKDAVAPTFLSRSAPKLAGTTHALREFTPPAGDSGCLECGVSLRW